MYTSLTIKILYGTTVLLIFLLGAYIMMAAYASSLASDRTVGYFLIRVRLSTLSADDKMSLLDDFHHYRARTKKGLKIDFESSSAALEKQNLGNLECTGIMIDFEKEAKSCLDSTSDNVLQSAIHPCPAADKLADMLKYQCSIDTGWVHNKLSDLIGY